MGKSNVNLLAGEGMFGESRMHASLMDAVKEVGGVPCETNPDVFFPEVGDFSMIREAKVLCRSCPVINLCGEYAIRFNMTDGIWGGFTPAERKRVRVRASAGEPLVQPKVVRSFVPYDGLVPHNVSNKQRALLAGQDAVELLPVALQVVGDRVPADTRQVVEIRLSNPSLTLKEVGLLCTPPVSKHVVAGRIRRLLAVARKVK
jgi:hypothetical protein